MYISPYYVPRFGIAYLDYLSRVLKRKHYGQTHKYRK